MNHLKAKAIRMFLGHNAFKSTLRLGDDIRQDGLRPAFAILF